jgi:PAS domain S-box-containing protein
MCLFYESQAELTDILVRYFRTGLENNEFCMWITADSIPVEQAAASLRKGIANVDKYLGKSQLEILNYNQWYIRRGCFNAQRVLRSWSKKETHALKQGFHGIRVLGDASWLDQKHWQAFTHYEAEADRLLGQRRVLAICAYPLKAIGACWAIDVIRNHEVALVKQGGVWQALMGSGHKRLHVAQPDLLKGAVPRIGGHIARLKAEEPRRKLQKHYQYVIDQLPFGIGLSTLNGKVIAGNHAMSALFGYSVEELRRLGSAILYETPADRKRLVEKLHREERATAFPTRMRCKNGRVFDALLTAERTRFCGLDCFQVIVQDITGQKMAKLALAAAERRLEPILDKGYDVVVLLTREGFVLCASPLVRRFLGYAPDELAGLNWFKLVYTPDPRSAWRVFMRLLKSPGESVNAQTRFCRKDRSCVWGEWIGTNMLHVPEVQAVVINIRDAAERNQAQTRRFAARPEEQQLWDLTGKLVEIDEAERHRLATELHDQVGQRLAALSAGLNLVRGQLPPDFPSGLGARLEASLQLAEEIAFCTRNLMAEFSAPVLADYGLLAALRWYAMRISSQTALRVQVQGSEPAPRLEPAKETTLYRIAQEAVTNVVKHARASQAIITVEAGPKTVRLAVTDDGVGFDPAAAQAMPTGASIGLATMRQRASTTGGRLEVQSAPGRGTCIVAELAR